MKYFFVQESPDATGNMSQDAQPQHVHCESLLVMDPSVAEYEHHPHSRWRCPDCGTAGWVQYLPEYIRRRETEIPDPPRRPDPPESPLDWQHYLDDYFSEGVLFLGVHDLPEYPVRDTSVFVLSDRVYVTLGPGSGPLLDVPERWCGRTHGMWDVERLTQIAPGTLIAHGTEGRKGRLDARLTDAEKAYIHRWKHTDYFFQREHCGAEECPHCADLDIVQPLDQGEPYEGNEGSTKANQGVDMGETDRPEQRSELSDPMVYVTRRGYGYNVSIEGHGNVLFVTFDKAEAIAKAEELASSPEKVVLGDLEEQW